MTMVKFKIGFVVSAETLFGLLAKMLPIDDLSVEEVIEGKGAPAPMPKIAQRLQEHIAKPKPKRKRRSKGVMLDAGINAIILRVLADGKPHRAIDIEPLLSAVGYSHNSVGSRLQNLREHGVITQSGDGKWQITEAHLKKSA